MWGQVADRFSTDSLGAFKEGATRYLGDKTNIGRHTLRDADWDSLYEEFRDN